MITRLPYRFVAQLIRWSAALWVHHHVHLLITMGCSIGPLIPWYASCSIIAKLFIAITEYQAWKLNWIIDEVFRQWNFLLFHYWIQTIHNFNQIDILCECVFACKFEYLKWIIECLLWVIEYLNEYSENLKHSRTFLILPVRICWYCVDYFTTVCCFFRNSSIWSVNLF